MALRTWHLEHGTWNMGQEHANFKDITTPDHQKLRLLPNTQHNCKCREGSEEGGCRVTCFHKHTAGRGLGSGNVTSPRSLVPWLDDKQSEGREGGVKPEYMWSDEEGSRVFWSAARSRCAARAAWPCIRTSSQHVVKRAGNCRLHLNFSTEILLNFYKKN